MKVAIHQPQYFPWPRYVHKVISADIFVYLDTVQFSKNGVQNRNQVKTANGAAWITVPVKQDFGQKLNEIAIADPGATLKHWKTLQANYARTSGFKLWRTELESLLTAKYSHLADLAVASTDWMLEKLDSKTKCIRASSLEGVEGKASQLVASICRHLGATSYLTGTGSLAYLDLNDFHDCKVQVQTWNSFQYEQPHDGFVSDLSTLDLLLNCPDAAAGLITTAGGWAPLSA